MANSTVPMWSVHDVFVQANVIHGFRYLDLSGVVINILSDRYKSINVITPEGTSMSQPGDNKDPFELQFGATRIWLHYVEIDAIQKIEGTAPEMIKSIAEKLEMKEFTRFGVRVSYFIATKDVLEAGNAITKKLVSASIAELAINQNLEIATNLEIPLLFKDMEVIFRFRWVVVKNPAVGPVGYSGNGLILDIDLGQRGGAGNFRKSDLAKLMHRAVESHTELLVKYGQPLLQGVSL